MGEESYDVWSSSHSLCAFTAVYLIDCDPLFDASKEYKMNRAECISFRPVFLSEVVVRNCQCLSDKKGKFEKGDSHIKTSTFAASISFQK
jgi:hypothetical protein